MDNRELPPKTSNFYCLPGRAGGTPMGISSERSAYLMKRPRFRLRVICSGVPCNATPQPSEKALLELAAREVGVSLTNRKP
jgi:hypothetical protein